MSVKKMVLAAAAVAAALVLTACGNAAEQAADVQQVAATTAAPTTSAPPAITTSAAPSPATSSSTPAPSTSSKTSTSKKTTSTTTKAKAAPAGVPCSATVDACVDLSAKKAWLLSDGEVVYGPVQIMPGSAGNPTPVGTFRVSGKVRDYHSREFDAPMPNSVFFQPGIAFHQGSLSKYSHGCIHLSTGASQKFFSTLASGDTVQVVR
ncbi:L,D-transpeptidase [Amycolatopsis thermoflava]|uniref:L,D-transpeptidase n=1 Tax=Amycolatopsis thermoflava TaxID=84480 RepID=UPI000426ABAA|nr:L,D-transpeptidase [Amycolatopsis thermoflava]